MLVFTLLFYIQGNDMCQLLSGADHQDIQRDGANCV